MERAGHPPDLLEHVLGSVHGDGKAERTGDERYVASDDDGTRGLALALLATDSSNPVHHHYTHKNGVNRNGHGGSCLPRRWSR